MKMVSKVGAFSLFTFGSALAQAAIVFSNLGTAAPPATVGTYAMQAFNTAPQAAIADFTNVTTIPGSPIPGSLTTTPVVEKRTVPGTWSTWSHGYTGPVFFSGAGVSSVTLTLPPGAAAFYLYIEPNNLGAYDVTATTNGGGSSGPVSVTGSSGATGFGFHTTASETLTTITITAVAGASGFAMGEFGIASGTAAPAAASIPTLSGWMLLLVSLMLGASAFLVQRRSR